MKRLLFLVLILTGCNTVCDDVYGCHKEYSFTCEEDCPTCEDVCSEKGKIALTDKPNYKIAITDMKTVDGEVELETTPPVYSCKCK